MAGLDSEGLRILGAREGEGGRAEMWGKLGERGPEKSQTSVSCHVDTCLWQPPRGSSGSSVSQTYFHRLPWIQPFAPFVPALLISGFPLLTISLQISSTMLALFCQYLSVVE